MEKKDILEYVMKTPENTNPAVLGDMLDEMEGRTPVLENISITENGTYTPAAGVDGFESVDVLVEAPPPALSQLEVSANGIYDPAGYYGWDRVEVDVPNTYGIEDEGMVVFNQTLVAQTARIDEITQNGTYDTTYNDSVSVEVATGFNTYETVTGTLASPFGDYTFQAIFSLVLYVRAQFKCYMSMKIDASALSLGESDFALYTYNDGSRLIGMISDVQTLSSTAGTITWDDTGLVSAYMEQNGTITDLSPYASQIITTLYLPR